MGEMKLDSEMEEQKECKDRLREELLIKELGFSNVVEIMIETVKKNPNLCLIGHNMMYDIIFLYNQFVGALPGTYAEFVQKWFEIFPLTFDTKVLSF